MDATQSLANEFMARHGVTMCANGCDEGCALSLQGMTGWSLDSCYRFAKNYILQLERVLKEDVRDLMKLASLLDEVPAPETKRSQYLPEGMTLQVRAIVVG